MYKIRQVHMSIGIEEDIVGFDIPVNDALTVNISQGTA